MSWREVKSYMAILSDNYSKEVGSDQGVGLERFPDPALAPARAPGQGSLALLRCAKHAAMNFRALADDDAVVAFVYGAPPRFGFSTRVDGHILAVVACIQLADTTPIDVQAEPQHRAFGKFRHHFRPNLEAPVTVLTLVLQTGDRWAQIGEAIVTKRQFPGVAAGSFMCETTEQYVDATVAVGAGIIDHGGGIAGWIKDAALITIDPNVIKVDDVVFAAEEDSCSFLNVVGQCVKLASLWTI